MNMAGVTNTETTQSLTTETELAQIKDQYGTSCKIIRQIGEYAYVVKVDFNDYNIGIKFQLKENYPTSSPIVILTWRYPETSLQDGLYTLISNEKTLTKMIHTARNWLETHKCLLVESTEVTTKKNKKQKKKQNKRQSNEDEEKGQKKPPMKTAIDVVSRILWDSNLQADQFTVGYIDRFVGITEKPFCILSWDDPAAVDDYEALAIPKHRIEYFKYKSLKVWDKPSRTDNVFGSSGEKRLNIHDVVERYEELYKEANPYMDDIDCTAKISEAETDDSDEDDDGITVQLHNPESEHDDDSHWQNKLRPNYFIAIRIDDADVLKMVEYVQDILITDQPLYESCCTKLSALHVTMCTLRLDTPEQISSAIRALRDVHLELREFKLRLKFEGMANFYGRVLYAQVHYEDAFLRLVDVIKLCLRTAGLELLDGQDFVPHLTIMKTSRPVSRVIGTNQIPKSVYSQSEGVEFGEQLVNNINLCSIEDDWKDGFYTTPLKLEL